MNAVVLCNGHPPDRSLIQDSLHKAELFIAADGGAHLAFAFDLTPDVVIGDLDSYHPTGEEDFEVIKKEDQETSDLEKALYWAAEQGATNVWIFGGTGRRLDQSLKNLSLLKRFQNKFDKLLLRDDFGDTMLCPNPWEARLAEGTLISLFPLSGRVDGIKTEGLRYPLNDEPLINGERDGSSNQVTGSPVRISYQKGDLILFIGR